MSAISAPTTPHTTVDDLVKRLRRLTYSKMLKNDFKNEIGQTTRPKSTRKPYIQLIYNLKSPIEAVSYFDYYFHLQIPEQAMVHLSDEDATNMLFDIAHIPKELVEKRMIEESTMCEIDVEMTHN